MTKHDSFRCLILGLLTTFLLFHIVNGLYILGKEKGYINGWRDFKKTMPYVHEKVENNTFYGNGCAYIINNKCVDDQINGKEVTIGKTHFVNNIVYGLTEKE